MSVQINYKNSITKKNIANLVLFVDEKFNISSLKKHILSTEYSFIADLIKSRNLKKKILTFDLSSKQKIILVSIKKNITSSDAENLGAKFYDLFKDLNKGEFILNSNTSSGKLKDFVGYFLHGLKLKSYVFDKYKTKKNKKKYFNYCNW